MSTMIPIIALEEHYMDPILMSSSSNSSSPIYKMPEQITNKLKALDQSRTQDLIRNGISLQILSHVPSHASVPETKAANDRLSQHVQQNSDQYRAFAHLPMHSPVEAAEELHRCVTESGFVGALIDNHMDGRFYDDPHFWPVFEAAEKLGTVIYIHPTFAAEEMSSALYTGNYSEKTGTMLGAYGFGWHVDTGLQILRLFQSGFFEKYPKIKIILGHMGETLPYLIDRILSNPAFQKGAGVGKEGSQLVQRDLRTVWNENIWFTTSGMFSLAPMRCLLGTVKRDRILLSIDYPFSKNEQGREFLDRLGASGLVTEDELRDMAHGNAERLLGIQVAQ
jgi:predicted TIM-barrel fold metal-dependent hydrolase